MPVLCLGTLCVACVADSRVDKETVNLERERERLLDHNPVSRGTGTASREKKKENSKE